MESNQQSKDNSSLPQTYYDESMPPLPYIGRIAFTQDRPAKPNDFWCWLKDSSDLNVEIGTLLSVDGEDELLITVVSDLEYTSSTRDISTEFYGSGYGNPDIQPPTKPSLIRCAKLRTLFRVPFINAPPEGRWGVRPVNSKDLNLLSERFPSERRILGGFLKIGLDEGSPKSWYPIFLHADFLLGPEGAHVNISGVTGLATKTSYALFLAYSIFAWSRKSGEKIAIVLFNVKRKDFLLLHQLPEDWKKAKEHIDKWCETRIGNPKIAERVYALWQIARDFDVDPIVKPPQIGYFTYQGDPDSNLMRRAEYIRYGWTDIRREELIAALYRADEEPGEQQINLICNYFEFYSSEPLSKRPSFDRMLNELAALRQISSSRSRESMRIPQVGSWDEKTVSAVWRRLSGFLSKATHIIERRYPSGNPLTFQKLVEGFNIIQLNRLHDTEKRLLVNAVLRECVEGLELPEEQRKIDRVVVVVDELNKYAPRRWSPIKEQITDIVARGRDLKLSLIGAQQFASDIDNEVLGNSATRIVGRSDPSEIAKTEFYAQLGDLKEITPYLEKGQMVLFHPIHTASFIIWFPTPLHETITIV